MRLLVKKQIRLREVDIKDAEIIAEWFNDQKNVRFMSTLIRCAHHTKDTVEKEIKNINLNYERLFVVELEEIQDSAKNCKVIGYAGIDDIDFDDKRGEIFVIIGDRNEQKKGYGQEVIKYLLRIAFKQLELNSLFATSTVENKASSVMLEKTGFKKIGIRREFNYINGEFMDEIFYDLTKKDYLAQGSSHKAESSSKVENITF